TLILLDPHGPFRLYKFSSFISGFGPLFAEAMRDNNTLQINYILRLLDHQNIELWSGNFKTPPGFNTVDLLWHIENRRRGFTNKNAGFGTERLLYDLNPT